MDLVVDLPIVEALIRRAEALDEAGGDGAVHGFLIGSRDHGALFRWRSFTTWTSMFAAYVP